MSIAVDEVRAVGAIVTALGFDPMKDQIQSIVIDVQPYKVEVTVKKILLDKEAVQFVEDVAC